MRILKMIALFLLAIRADLLAQDTTRGLSDRQKTKILYSMTRGMIEASKLPVPDSLGGKRLLGGITIQVRVTRDGRLHGYKVGRIEVSPDTLHWFVYSPHSWKASGDSLLEAFRPWLNSYCRGMRVVGAEKDSMFLLMDTLSYNFVINFGDVRNLDTLTAKKRGLYPSIYREGR